MRYCEVVPIGYSHTDWLTLIKTLDNDFKISLKVKDIKDPTAFLQLIGNVEAKHRKVLKHAWLVLLSRFPPDLYNLINNNYPITIDNNFMGNNECVIVSGSMVDWYDSVVLGCSEDSDPKVNMFFTNVYDLLLTTPYKILFHKFRVVKLTDGRITLL